MSKGFSMYKLSNLYLQFLHKLNQVHCKEFIAGPMLPWGAPGTGCPRTLLPGEPQPLPVAHRGWHRTSHAACTEHYSRHAWHWCPLVFFSLKAPFSVVTWVLGERLFTCCQGWGWKQKNHQSDKGRREVQYASISVARESCVVG